MSEVTKVYTHPAEIKVTATVELAPGEIQVLVCAMAGNHPSSLADHRTPALRKLARAKREADARSTALSKEGQ